MFNAGLCFKPSLAKGRHIFYFTSRGLFYKHPLRSGFGFLPVHHLISAWYLLDIWLSCADQPWLSSFPNNHLFYFLVARSSGTVKPDLLCFGQFRKKGVPFPKLSFYYIFTKGMDGFIHSFTNRGLDLSLFFIQWTHHFTLNGSSLVCMSMCAFRSLTFLQSSFKNRFSRNSLKACDSSWWKRDVLLGWTLCSRLFAPFIPVLAFLSLRCHQFSWSLVIWIKSFNSGGSSSPEALCNAWKSKLYFRDDFVF